MKTAIDRLLVVDDDPALVRVVARTAERLGYVVQSVGTPDGVAPLLGDFRPTVVLLDLHLAGGDGVQVAEILAETRFEGALVLASGFDRRVLDAVARMARSRDLDVAATLEKPDGLATLSQVLKERRRIAALDIATELPGAVAAGQIVPHFQPIVSLDDGRISKAEVLARWNHPVHGVVSPGKFIPVAEDSGLIGELSWAVMNAALAAGRDMAGDGTPLALSLNVSARLLEAPSFLEDMKEMLARHGYPAQRIHLEITESAAMHDAAASLGLLSRLRLAGMGLSMDDFGTGYSSLRQLQRMPFNELKIDLDFVRQAPRDPECRVIVDALVLLAGKLGLSVVAEGVEDEACCDLLRELGAGFGQGFHLGRPMPAEALRSALAARV